jgi:hypothetical protein
MVKVFCELIIKAMPELVKFFVELELDFYFTKPQVRHMQAFVVAMMLDGFDGKMSQVSELALHADRTCVSRFLNSNSWNDEFLVRALNAHVINIIWNYSRETGLPIYIIIDDTICEKTKPSSKAKQPIYGCGFHKSHLKNAFVYGQQFVVAALRCGDKVLPLAVHLYERNETGKEDKEDVVSKIDIAKGIVEALPKPVNKGYVVADSWYSCITLFDAAQSSGYHYVGALKSNRKIFPRKYRRKGIQIGAFARSLSSSDFDVVTVDGERYYMYTYLGKINDMNKVKIVITYPVKALFVPQAMKAFISTDIKMNGWQLLHHYTMRWPIEVFFREANRRLGMKQCQVRTKKAILRFQYLIMMAYTFCGLELDGRSIDFCHHRKIFQRNIQRSRIEWIVHETQNGISLNDILTAFRLAS